MNSQLTCILYISLQYHDNVSISVSHNKRVPVLITKEWKKKYRKKKRPTLATPSGLLALWFLVSLTLLCISFTQSNITSRLGTITNVGTRNCWKPARTSHIHTQTPNLLVHKNLRLCRSVQASSPLATISTRTFPRFIWEVTNVFSYRYNINAATVIYINYNLFIFYWV